MEADLLWGEKIRLVVENPQVVADAFARWGRDSEYMRLLDSDAPRLWSIKATKDWLAKTLEQYPPQIYFFTIYTLEDERLIGFIGLEEINWQSGDAYVGIGIGERDYQSRGYGTDAMRVILRFAFRELNLHRVSLSVFEYNQRAIRSYEKAGFKIEGRARQWLNRDGERTDLVFMGILREEWESQQRDAAAQA